MEIWPIEGPWPGQLAVCSRPRAGWFLDDDLRALREAGYRVLVSALTPDEVVVAELQRVPDICDEVGIEFHHFPVGNLQVAPLDRARPQVDHWHERLLNGENIAVHCWATVGRGPTIAAALLIRGGIPATETWGRIIGSRGRDCPDTLEQRRWAASFGEVSDPDLAPES
ncbi:MAG: tyrosine protein phosphatase [bacterium]